ncbi:MAG: hypothetical protein KGL39_43955 [Patescibacteria group bacterium]|nr:hypothetical protein [Patescibacteria group bacterium]
MTVGFYGCTTTCLSMLSDYFGCYVSPDQLAHNAHNYTPDGLIVWSNLLFGHMAFVQRDFNPTTDGIFLALAGKDTAVMLEVQLAKGKHWLVGARNPYPWEFGHKGDFRAADPWTGKYIWVKQTYGNITGAAFFKRFNQYRK